jgi:hypothetical protein
MIEKFFVCLANSAKNKGRCLGGIEIVQCDNKKWRVVRDPQNNPKWIRPVTRTGMGEIPQNEASKFKSFDIIRLTDVQECPCGAQSENLYYGDIKNAGHLPMTIHDADNLCDRVHREILFNTGASVMSNVFANGNYSLMFIKPQNVKFTHSYDSEKERDKFRVSFTYNSSDYDLPVTDKNFMREAETHGERQAYLDERYNVNCAIYLTISLGVPLHDRHYKLVANVTIIL